MADPDTWRPLLDDNVIRINPDPDAADQAQLRREVGFWLLLPLPPSENALTKNVPGRGRAKKPEYLAWIDAAQWTVKEARSKGETCVYDEPVQVHVYIRPRQLKSGKPDINRSDAPNYLKALLDLLTPPKGRKKHGMGLIRDDSMAWLRHGSWTVVDHDDHPEHTLPPGWCRVRITPLEASP